MLSTGLAKNWCQELIHKVITSAVFLVTYTKKRNTHKASYAMWFALHLSMFNI